MKVLITGGAGYLGSILSDRLLSRGHAVRVLDSLLYGGGPLLGLEGRDGFEFIRADLRDREAVRGALGGIEAVVHLAAIVGDPACARQPDTARQVNLQASLDLLREAREAGARRFVFASTCINYGRMADTSKLAREDSELRPVSLYAETKVAMERELLALPREPIAATVMRYARLYGLSPRMRFDLTVNELVKEMMPARELLVDGEQFWRPCVHVRDAARATAMALEAPLDRVAGQVFNVGDSDENYRKADLVEMMTKRIPGAEVQTVRRAEDTRDYRVSFARVRERLGFEVSRPVPDGIAELAHALEAGPVEDASNPRHYNVLP